MQTEAEKDYSLALAIFYIAVLLIFSEFLMNHFLSVIT